MVVKGAFGPKVCPQVQIGRDSVSASAISASTNTPIIGKTKTLHAAYKLLLASGSKVCPHGSGCIPCPQRSLDKKIL
jgi:hypothetical protein